jgi:hypothetical protein
MLIEFEELINFIYVFFYSRNLISVYFKSDGILDIFDSTSITLLTLKKPHFQVSMVKPKQVLTIKVEIKSIIFKLEGNK